MQKLDFLKQVLPTGTRYSLRVVKGTGKNYLFSSIEELIQASESERFVGQDLYYATAGFGAGTRATSENIVAKKEFYVDIDCGPNKPYPSKAEGAQALIKFCKVLQLPKPIVVDSGMGLHAHWALANAIPVHEWTPVANTLKTRCVEYSFNVDGTCTADGARVLRIPETINTKNGATVSVLIASSSCDFEAFKAALGHAPQIDLSAAKRLTKMAGGASEASKFLWSNKTSKFQVIWAKSVNGNGCAQVKHAIEEAATLAEPMWRAVLSIAQACEDRDWAIHEVSKDHPDYDPDNAEKKAAATKGPYTCETYQGMESAALCSGCKYLGKITSPIQLGVEVAPAALEDNKVKTTVAGEVTEFEIPSYPAPFFRGKHGGIYRYGKEDEESGEVKQELVYPHDVYVFKRLHDVEHGDTVFLRLHLPRDGIRTFALRQSDIASKDRLRDEVNKNGVTIMNPVQIQNFQYFLSLQITDLQFREKADIMNVRYGWTEDNTFVVGEREYTRKGVKYASSANALSNINRSLALRGDLEVWKEVAAAYENELFDMHALGVLAGFGSVLMHISPEHGGVLNYYSKASGTGKTTILKLANSIWGSPMGLMMNAADTAMAKVNRMGLLNGIVFTVDEMTNASPEEISGLLYGSTQGRARNRMRAKENLERENNATWKTISVWSSNSSLEDRLSLMKLDPQGELARLLEIHLRTPVPSDVLESQNLFNQLADNYGVAGDVFLRYVVPNLDSVRNTWLEVRDRIYGMHNWTQTERYRLNLVVCMITAGIIAKSLNLINYDIKRLTKKATELVRKSAEHMRENSTKSVENIAMFVNENINNMLIIRSVASVGTISEVPIRVPNRGQLTLRYEPDTKTLYIAQRDFNKWCATNQINSREMRSMFKDETNQEIGVVKKRMGKGWDADFGPVSAYEIKNAVDVLGLDEADLASN